MDDTLWDLVVNGLVDAGVYADRETAIRALTDTQMTVVALAALLKTIGWTVPAYSGTVRCHLIERNDDD